MSFSVLFAHCCALLIRPVVTFHSPSLGPSLGHQNILLGIGAARIYLAPDSPERTKALRLYLVQLAVNFFWSNASPLYFSF